MLQKAEHVCRWYNRRLHRLQAQARRSNTDDKRRKVESEERSIQTMMHHKLMQVSSRKKLPRFRYQKLGIDPESRKMGAEFLLPGLT
jgi:hypothetical protein